MCNQRTVVNISKGHTLPATSMDQTVKILGIVLESKTVSAVILWVSPQKRLEVELSCCSLGFMSCLLLK